MRFIKINNMFVLGLTGGIASGKTTATDFFSKKGIDVVDADEISRNLQKKGQAGYLEILKRYGKDILGAGDEIDRKKLREIAFSQESEKQWLEDLMHPLIRETTMNAFNNVKSKWSIYSAPLWNDQNKFERVLVIDAPKHLQIQRIKEFIENQDFDKGEGSEARYKILPDYFSMIINKINIVSPIKVVMDCGNAAAAINAPNIFKNLGVE